MSASQNLDPAALERLQRLGGDAFVCKMIDLFLDYAARKISEARAAQVAGNFTSVEKAVHPLKSSAANVGATHVQELAVRLEDLARQNQAEALAISLGELELAFADVEPELERHRQSLSARIS